MGFISLAARDVSVADDSWGAPSDLFEKTNSTLLTGKIETQIQRIFDAFNERDLEAYLRNFTEDAVVLVNGGQLFRGVDDISQLYFQSPEALRYHSIGVTDQKIIRAGDYIFDVGLAAFRFKLGPDQPVLSDPRVYLTIWKEREDGSLGVRALSWNTLVDSNALKQPNVPLTFDRIGKCDPISQKTLNRIRDLETKIDKAYSQKKLSHAAEFYADNAVLLVPGSLPKVGAASVREYLEALPPDQLAVSSERMPVEVFGNEDVVVAVNLFRWQFKTPDERDAYVSGKGIHVWVRDAKNQWKLLFDLPNPSQTQPDIS